MVLGEHAERRTEERIRAALPDGARCFANVRWLAPPRDGGPARNGEIDLLLVLPDVGILVIETKAGPVTRDGFGRWYAGSRRLDEAPFKQVEDSGHAIVGKIEADPAWHGQLRMIHAVALPDTDRESLGRDAHGLGTDAPTELVLDRTDLGSDEATAVALARVIRYVGATRAKHHLVVIAPPALARRLEPSESTR